MGEMCDVAGIFLQEHMPIILNVCILVIAVSSYACKDEWLHSSMTSYMETQA